MIKFIYILMKYWNLLVRQ